MKYSDGTKLGDVVNTEMDCTVIPQKKNWPWGLEWYQWKEKNSMKFRVMHLCTKPKDLFCTAADHQLDSTEEQTGHLITDHVITWSWDHLVQQRNFSRWQEVKWNHGVQTAFPERDANVQSPKLDHVWNTVSDCGLPCCMWKVAEKGDTWPRELSL